MAPGYPLYSHLKTEQLSGPQDIPYIPIFRQDNLVAPVMAPQDILYIPIFRQDNLVAPVMVLRISLIFLSLDRTT